MSDTPCFTNIEATQRGRVVAHHTQKGLGAR